MQRLPVRERRSRTGLWWQNRDFRLFWIGETVSMVGTQVTALALPLTAILVLDSSTEQVGLLRMAQLLPYLLLSLLFGALADRMPRRPLMVGANAVRLVLIGLVPILAVTGQLSLGWLYVVTAGVGVAAVMFDVCWVSYVPTIVADHTRLIEANSRIGAADAAAHIGGPGLAGVLVNILTAPIALVVNAASYAVSIAMLLQIRAREVKPERSDTPRNLRAELGEGLRWVFGNPLLRILAILGACYNFFLMFIQTVFLVYAVRELSLSTAVIGGILSSGAVGGLIGAASAQAAARRFGVGRVYVACASVSFSSWIVVPAAGGPPVVLTAVLVAVFLVSAVAMGATNVIVVSLRQTLTPDTLMARMNAVMRMLMLGVAALGGPVGGGLATVIGLRPALWVAAGASILAFVVFFPRRILHLTELPEPAATR
ncbi:MFS transporter [Micromonospora antibiotica]|uniref:MFS transporter n=1 Tax=Micromonospora antibiotica TaxID=2807623 RepID=A0ABS3VGG0_9ACTN|nr:MFS transporter [Micromonospora antibiotica]MBO4164716.1 MFS transporter [Micromonospora antibiotica]